MMVYKVDRLFKMLLLSLLVGILLTHNVLCLSVKIVNKRPYAFTNKLYVVANVSTVVATNTTVYFLLNNTTVYTTPLIVLGNNSYKLINFTYTLNDNGVYNITVIAHNETDGTNVTDYFIVNASIYEASVNYSNYVYYDGNKYVDTLKYDVSYRCNFIGENKTLYGYFDDGSNSTEIACLPDIANNLTRGLVLHLGEDEGKGNITYDYSGHSNNGTINNMYALQFDGVDDYVEVLNTSTMQYQEMTIVVWVWADDQPDTSFGYHNDIIRKNKAWSISTTSDDSFGIRTLVGRDPTQTYDHWLTWTLKLKPYSWNFVVLRLVYDNVNQQVTATLTVNNQSETLVKTDTVLSANTYFNVYIANGAGGPYKGKIAEVRIYNRTLSDTEIQDLYTHGPGYAGNTTGLVLWLDFSKKTLVDQSGNGNDGVAYGNPQWVVDGPYSGWTNGKLGKALRFDGVDDYINMGDVADPYTNDWTVTVWIKTDGSGTFAANLEGIVTKNPHAGDGRWGIYLDSTGSVRGFLSDTSLGGDVWTISSTKVNDNKWHFIVVVYDRDGNMTLYIDGVKEDEVDISASNGINFDITTPLVIGASRGQNPYYFFKGLIDEVRIYDRALSPEEIKALYLAGIKRHITGSYKFKTEGIKQVHFQLYNETFGYDTFIADLKPPYPILYYDVLPSGKPVVNVYVDENISPITTCSILVNGEPYVINKTLNSRTVSPDYTWLLDNVEYGYNNITAVCSDLVGHIGANTKFLGISPNLLKTIDWDYPSKYYVGEDAEISGTISISNVGNAPIKQKTKESIPFTYGEDVIIKRKDTGEVIAKYDKWIGPIDIEIPLLRPGESVVYEVDFKIPTAEITSKKEYFLIEAGAKYNVYEYEISVTSPIILNNLVFTRSNVDCNAVSKVVVDNVPKFFTCHNNKLYVELGTVMPGQKIDVRIYSKGPIETYNNLETIKKKTKNLWENIINQLNNISGNIVDYFNQVISSINEAISSIIRYFSNFKFW